MFSFVCEYFKAASPVPLALSATSPAARRAVERSSRGYVVQGLRLHHEEFRKDEEVSCHRRPTRTVCIHAESIPLTFFHALWWIRKDGAHVPVVFRAARLTGSLYYGVNLPPATDAVAPADATVASVLSMHDPAVASLVRRTVSLFVGGSRLRAVQLNPSAVTELERIDVSNCRCLTSLQWSRAEAAADGAEDSGSNSAEQLHHLRILKASFSGLVVFPAPTLAAWAPALTTALLSGCRALSREQVNNLLDDCLELRVARLDSTKLSSIDSFALTCPRLSELNVSNCADLQDVSALAALSSLRVLDLHGNASLASLDGVGGGGPLRRLDISHCKRISTLRPLEGRLTKLERFNASHCSGLLDTQLGALRTSLLLEEVKVNQCPSLRDFSALSHHANLTVVEAADTAIAGVDFLRSCTALERLSVAGCANLTDLTALRGLYRLVSVDACHSGVTRMAELLDTCSALRVVLVRDCELDTESTDRLEACAPRIASTHRAVNSGNSAPVTATA
ncbi:hypothetical protein ABB37_05647 [Leptomonas pyrrhocoris]|uniref:Uncharacterized protein n=1 Tax=Leptomonas pyrrhocoris TaxID=157538 RepID=A0A0N0DUM1_LEPPY|nr:hypothetical protein ABB37_05647 [Leptomonas pyrrhocoris]XP_015657578.1 hypothetical protein ABB37_05647 [Leptomonas pyrrhocoris]KPA79138.1 hypothetical protein ABB37_05647 [Leptomonas pyrrhocoris]KPA79139.1 hypothetical protein ABB37_05647 [Leptomonas pyrrhocoris]|eukprot:XP_015657577.1 hypothetical protein ABB37_05647 [Leptomonas pyrrhocoris]